ncbi:hypothetical protein JVT61DRAFT_6770 [Boletus reticuloceps]|uniref:Uncharacterized protein n=1 Tax=Boletus reticuloceps TaxID=495285 RepID=A0A8I2YJT0_9AGAM|nr:hypothetical protein JVT61DRAFT_6770 [Boletus reticuloceps]
MDKGPTFQTVACAKAKKHKVKDEHLSWEEFSQAKYCKIVAMKQQEWPEERIKMVHNFWIAFEMHDWRHDTSEYCKKALLLYQGRIRTDWHKTLGTSAAFCLLLLCKDHLDDLHHELLDNAYAAKMDTVPTFTLSPPSFSPSPKLIHTHPGSICGCLSIHADFVRDAGTACCHLTSIPTHPNPPLMDMDVSPPIMVHRHPAHTTHGICLSLPHWQANNSVPSPFGLPAHPGSSIRPQHPHNASFFQVPPIPAI